jgi:hypothetical protein
MDSGNTVGNEFDIRISAFACIDSSILFGLFAIYAFKKETYQVTCAIL